MSVTYRYATPWFVPAATIVALTLASSAAAQAPSGDAPQSAGGWKSSGNSANQTGHLPLSTGQRRPLARLIRNPDTAGGLPPYALTDQAGKIQRYVEPVPGIDLEPYIGYAVTVKRDTGRTLLASQLGLPGQESSDRDDDALHDAPQRTSTHSPDNIQALFSNLIDAPQSQVVPAQYVQAPQQPMMMQNGGQPMMVQQGMMPQAAAPQVMLPPGAVPQGPLPPGVVPYDPNNPAMAGTPWTGYPQQGVAPVYVDGANPCDGMQCPPYAAQQVPCPPYAMQQMPCPQPVQQVPCAPLVQVQQPPPWQCYIWGDFLWLHPTGVDMAHAQQQNGIGGAGTVPFGEIGVVDPDFDIGFRVGGEFRFDPKESVFGSYTWFQSNSTSHVAAPTIPGGGGAVGSLVQHPGAAITASAGPVDAGYDIDFQSAEINCRYLIECTRYSEISAYWGGRWADLQQKFNQTGIFGGGQAGTIDTSTNIQFDGGGPMIGLAGERLIGQTRFSSYGHISAAALEGQFSSHYLMNNSTTATLLAQSDWHDDRIVPMLDYELGVAWTAPSNHLRLAVGYMASHWFNIVSTPTFVDAVQADNYVNVHDTLSFDGLVGHAELRW
ncbi:MAG TPA: Lpg1974 family pore-forming outer membrane protein [Lacipirellulaceae bacterium]|jgi:hypothetical protein